MPKLLRSRMLQICLFSILCMTNNSFAQIVWSENWEGNWIDNWTVSGGTWEVGIPTSGPNQAHEGTQCAATVLAGNYTEPVDSRLIRFTSFTVPSADQNPRLRFWHWYNFAGNDTGYVEISIDNGLSWQTIGEKFFNTGSNVWTYPSIDLTAYANTSVKLAFRIKTIYSGFGNVAPGWYIDEVAVLSGPILYNNPENWESGIGDWYVDQGTWEVGTPTSGPNQAHEGTQCAATVLSGNYAEPVDARLISPQFTVPSADQNPRLRFWHWYNFAGNDTGYVEISIDNGLSWQTIGEKFFNTGSNVWTYPSIDLTAYANTSVKLAFRIKTIYSGFGNVAPGWYIDEVAVLSGPILYNNPENWESGIGDWYVDQGTWEVGTPTSGPNQAHEGTQCAATVLSGNYAEPVDARLISPQFTVPSADQNPRLRFWHWYNFAGNDTGYVEISIDNGLSWQTIGEKFFNTGSNVWTYPSIDLTAYANTSVKLAFRIKTIYSGFGNVAPGWYIDEVAVLSGPILYNNPENWESGIGDWYVDQGTWEVGTPTSGPNQAHEGTQCAATVLSGNYAEPVDARLISPQFTVPSADQNPRLRFWHWYNFAGNDTGYVEISIDNGLSWQTIGEKFFNTGSNVWTYPSIDLTAYANTSVKLAFRIKTIYSGFGNVAPGWYIDEVAVLSGPILYNNPENWESGIGDWYVDQGTWEVGTPTSGPNQAHEGTQCAATVLGGNYAEPVDSRLISPQFTVPSASQSPYLRFWHWYNFSANDTGYVQIKVGSSDWQTINGPYFNTSSNVWTPVSFIDLIPYSDSTIQIAFRTKTIYSGFGNVAAGWYIDEIYISGLAINFPLAVSVNDGWNMVSIPGSHPVDQNVDTWWQYRDLSANVFKYSGGYQPIFIATPTEGYWMKHSGVRVYNTGDEWPLINIVTHDSISAATGWNLIGGYENSALTAGLTTNPPELIDGPVYKYSGGYQVATTLDPGQGYWIKLSGSGQIVISESLTKETKPVEYFKKDWGRIIIADNAGHSYKLYAVGSKNSINLSVYELPPAPPEGMFDIRYSSGRIAEDINSSIKEIEMSGVTYPLTVKVEGMDIRMMDEGGRILNVSLKDGEEIIISDGTIQKLMVTGELIPTFYSLEQNYPNPFNPSTLIEFSLPEDVTNVKLSIYNALGEKVTELVNTSLTAGKYQYQWNAQNVATGMYIYELRTDKFVSVKKMLLMK